MLSSVAQKLEWNREDWDGPCASMIHKFVKHSMFFAPTSIFVWIYKLTVGFEWWKGEREEKAQLPLCRRDSKKDQVNRLCFPTLTLTAPHHREGPVSMLNVIPYSLWVQSHSTPLIIISKQLVWLEVHRARICQIAEHQLEMVGRTSAQGGIGGESTPAVQLIQCLRHSPCVQSLCLSASSTVLLWQGCEDRPSH